MKTYKIFFPALLVVFSSTEALCQEGELGDEQINVIKPYQPILSDAYKVSDLPVRDTVVFEIPKQTYSLTTKKFPTAPEVYQIKAVKIKDEAVLPLEKSYVKAGFGNYTTPYFEFFTNNLRSRDYAYGVHLKHLSSSGTINGVGYPGYSDNIGSVYGKRIFEKGNISGNINYHREVVHKYGFNAQDTTITKDEIRQLFKRATGMVTMASNDLDSETVKYRAYIKFHYFDDINKSIEKNFIIGGVFGKQMGTENFSIESKLDVTGNKYLIVQQTPSFINETKVAFGRTLLTLIPAIKTKRKDISATLGMNYTMSQDSILAQHHFYPVANISVNLANEYVIAFAGMTGNMIKNNLNELTSINPFLNSTPNLRQSNNRIEYGGGFRGFVSKSFSYKAGVQYQEIDTMAFFSGDWGNPLQNSFEVIYDNVELMNFYAESEYKVSEKYAAGLKAVYHRYTMSAENKPWYKPEFEVTLSGKYNYNSKISATADLFLLGKQYARVFYPEETKTIDPLVDVNFGAAYQYSGRLSFFGNFNNIAASRYYRWNNYPSQKFNFIAGLGFTF